EGLPGLPGVGGRLPHVGCRLRLVLLEPGRGLALARELLARYDADQVVPLDLLEAAGLEDRLECRLPGDVAERDRHLALHVVADDDVLAALGREDAEEVDDIRVLEVEGDELLARGPRRGRGGRRRGLRDLGSGRQNGFSLDRWSGGRGGRALRRGGGRLRGRRLLHLADLGRAGGRELGGWGGRGRSRTLGRHPPGRPGR